MAFPTIVSGAPARGRTPAVNTLTHSITETIATITHQPGDLIVAHVAAGGSHVHYTEDAGWVRLRQQTNGPVGISIFGKIAESSSETLVVTSARATQSCHTVYVLRPRTGMRLLFTAGNFGSGWATSNFLEAFYPNPTLTAQQDYLALHLSGNNGVNTFATGSAGWSGFGSIAPLSGDGGSSTTEHRQITGVTTPSGSMSASPSDVDFINGVVAVWEVPAAFADHFNADAQGTTATPGAVAVTGGVARGALGVVAYFGGYGGGTGLTSISSNFTGDWTILNVPLGGNSDCAILAYARVTSYPQNPTYTPVFNDAWTGGPIAQLAFVKDIPATGPWVRDADVVAADGHLTPLTLTVDTSATDTVLAFLASGGGVFAPLPSGWNWLAQQSINEAVCQLSARAHVAGSTATFTTAAGTNYDTCGLISILQGDGDFGPAMVVDEGASTGVVFSDIVDGGEAYRLATISSTGSLVVSTAGAAEWLLVPGGGSGGSSGNSYSGGGGGSAGPVKPGKGIIPAGTFAIVAGLGGASPATTDTGNDGARSSLGDHDSVEGGIGGALPQTDGRTGGAGAGGTNGVLTVGGAASRYGWRGGSVLDPYCGCSAGGAGAGQQGVDQLGHFSEYKGANGGKGVLSSITGTSLRYGGGGSGAQGDPYVPLGGEGGGGNGSFNFDAPASAGTDGLGGGGGGASGNGRQGGKGGNGIVYVRWRAGTPPPPPQFARPDEDIVDGAWVPSTGTDLNAVVNKPTVNDATYAYTNSNSEFVVGLSNVSTPVAGSQSVVYRAAGSPHKRLVVGLYRGASLIQSWTTDPLVEAVTEYIGTLTTALTDVSNLRLSAVVENAAAPPALDITYGDIGTTSSTTATTTLTAAYPSGITATSALYLIVTGRSNTAATAPAVTGGGWTSIGSLESGIGTWGVDAGTRRVQIFRKDTVTGTETGNVTVTLAGTTNNTLYARIIRVQAPARHTIAESFASGADTTAGTGFSAAASSNLTFGTGDLLVIAHAGMIDTATQSAQSITASGVTFGTRTNRASIAVTGGNDHRHVIDTVSVTTGSGTPAAPTYAYTASANTSGVVGFLLIRAVPPTEFARVTQLEFRLPGAADVEPASPYSVWNGSAWLPGDFKVWNGTAWVEGVLKRWNGTAWV